MPSAFSDGGVRRFSRRFGQRPVVDIRHSSTLKGRSGIPEAGRLALRVHMGSAWQMRFLQFKMCVKIGQRRFHVSMPSHRALAEQDARMTLYGLNEGRLVKGALRIGGRLRSRRCGPKHFGRSRR